MDFYIINVFHEAAFAYCTAILEKGFEVCAIGTCHMENFMAEEEEMWMRFGRNANLIYEQLDEFLQGTLTNEESRLIYFPFQHKEELEIRLFEKIDQWGERIYIISDELEKQEGRNENYIFMPDCCEKFIQNFVPE